MIKSILHISLFLAVSLLFSQEKKLNFPDDFLGIYKGTLVIQTPSAKKEIPMEFHMQKTDSLHKFSYVLVYDGMPRNYTLVVKDKEKGLFEIDEKNGIVLPAKYNDSVLYSFFEVQNNFLSSRLAFYKTELIFEILFSNKTQKTTTGGKGKEIPIVYGFPISTVQKAVLLKQE